MFEIYMASSSLHDKLIEKTEATASWNFVHRHPRALKIKVNNHRIYMDYFQFLNNFL